jgi:hypothetical protein
LRAKRIRGNIETTTGKKSVSNFQGNRSFDHQFDRYQGICHIAELLCDGASIYESVQKIDADNTVVCRGYEYSRVKTGECWT